MSRLAIPASIEAAATALLPGPLLATVSRRVK